MEVEVEVRYGPVKVEGDRGQIKVTHPSDWRGASDVIQRDVAVIGSRGEQIDLNVSEEGACTSTGLKRTVAVVSAPQSWRCNGSLRCDDHSSTTEPLVANKSSARQYRRSWANESDGGRQR